MMDDRKKREPPDPEGQPTSKRHALSISTPAISEEDVDPKEAPVLLYQNKAMQIRIKEMRMELQSHETTIRELNQKQKLYDETIGCTHRVWDQFTDSSLKLLSRLIISADQSSSKGEGTTLAHLLLQTPEPIHETTEFDQALQSRVAGTAKILQRLVDAVESERANNERLTALLKEQAPAAAQQRIQQLEAENKNLTASLNNLQDTQKQASRTQSHIEAQNRSYLQQIEDLQNKIYQFETELTITRRKVIKQECPLPVGVIAQPRTTASTTTTTTTTAPATNGADVKKEEGSVEAKQNGGDHHEMVDLQAMAEGRLEEAGKLREEKIALLKENSRLKDELAHLSTDRISSSEPYKRLERETKSLRADLERERDTTSRMRADLNLVRDSKRRDREAIEKEESAKRRVLDNQVRELQEYVLRLKTESLEIQGLVEKRMAGLPSEKYIQELKLLVTMRDADVKKLREECERLNIVNKQLHERKGDKMEETVQAKLIEVSELTDKVRKLERDIEDYARKEKSWTSRERDYRNMVDNFQASSKDRRDVHDLRAAERRLRDEVEDLRIEKDELRKEKDELRRTYEKSQRAEAVREVEKKKDDEIKALKADADKAAAKANFQIKELKTELESKTQDYDVMITEVDSISKLYEDMQTQNKRLLEDLGSKEDVTIQVASESMKMKKQIEQTRIETKDMQERYARADERCRVMVTQIEDLENQVSQANLKFAKAFDELQNSGMGIDGLRREARDSQVQASEYRQQIEVLEKSSLETRRKVEDLVVEVEKEKERVRRLEEDKSSLKRKLDRAAPLKGSSSGAVNYVEEELKALKQKLTCNVCNDRMKDTVIAKCFHVFCHECVATNLQIRKRRCPQCQASFSQNDVHSLYGYV